MFTALDHPLFAWSGGNATVTNEIDNSELVNIGPSHAKVYYRAKDRAIPHNLYSKTADLYTQTPPFAPPAKQQFVYREPDAPAAGTPSAGVSTKLDSIDVDWTWNAKDGVYFREMEGNPHMDRNSGQISTNNVVVLAMDYAPGISGSPDAQTARQGRGVRLHRRQLHPRHLDTQRHPRSVRAGRRRRHGHPAAARPHVHRTAPARTAPCRSAPPDRSHDFAGRHMVDT